MDKDTETTKLLPYSITELPLTNIDIDKLKKIQAASYKMNILLLPLLVIIFFWGIIFFVIFLALVIICNLVFTSNYNSINHQLANPKIVVTGTISKIIEVDGTVIYFGDERFEITYANANFPMQVNDIISIHYAKKEDNTRGNILYVEKASQ